MLRITTTSRNLAILKIERSIVRHYRFTTLRIPQQEQRRPSACRPFSCKSAQLTNSSVSMPLWQAKPPDIAPDPEADKSKAIAIQGVQAIFDRWHLIADADPSGTYDGFDAKVMKEAKLLDASIGLPTSLLPGQPITPPSIVSSCTTSLHIDATYRNQNNVMHGGAYGVVMDMLTTIALGPIARPGYWDYLGGVTRVLNVNYLKAIPLGTTVHVHAYVYQVGRTMALIQGWMTSEDGRVVYATCDHHKVRSPTREEHLRCRVPWDEYWERVDAKL